MADSRSPLVGCLAIAVLLVGIVGFVADRLAREVPPPPARSVEPRERVASLPAASPKLVVLTESSTVATAHALARARDDAEQQKFLDDLVDTNSRSWHASSRSIRRLQRDPVRVEPLRALARDRGRPPVVRLRAAHILIRVGDPLGWPTVIEVMSAVERKEAAGLLSVVPTLSFEANLTGETVGALTPLLEHSSPEVSLAALRLMLDAGRPATRGDLSLIERAANTQPPASTHRLKFALEGFLRRAEGPLQTSALRLLERLLRSGDHRQMQLLTFARYADPAAIPFLEEELARPEATPGTMTWDRQACLTALARLHAPGIRQRLFDQLASKESWIAVEPLGVLAAGTGDDAVLERVRGACRTASTPVKMTCVRAVMRIGGPRVREVVQELSSGLLLADRMELEAELAGVTVDNIWKELQDLRLVTGPLPEPTEDDRGIPKRQVMAGLHKSGRFVGFDVETGFLPVPHDELIEDFAAASGGAFRPEAAIETWHSNGARSGLRNDLEPLVPGEGYTVQFVHGDKLYRFHAEDRGDWYDVHSVVMAIHKALEDAGRSERFVGLFTGGQDARYIFGDPAAIAQAAQRKLLSLDTSDTAAEERGKAFERKAIEALGQPQQ
jgi:hypothetical protein